MERRVNQHQAIGGLEQAITVLSVAIVTREALNERYRAGVASLLELLDAEDVEQRA